MDGASGGFERRDALPILIAKPRIYARVGVLALYAVEGAVRPTLGMTTAAAYALNGTFFKIILAL